MSAWDNSPEQVSERREHTMGEHEQQGGHRYAKADEELTGFFTAALGVKAQSYQGNGGGAFDSQALHDQRLKAMRAGGMAWFDRVGQSIQQLPADTYRTLSLLYTPRSWPDTLVKAFREADPPKPEGWPLGAPWEPLPAWRTVLVGLAVTLPRAHAASGRVESMGVVDWLLERSAKNSRITVQADRKHEEQKHAILVRNLMDDAIALRQEAVATYDQIRIVRVIEEERLRREGLTPEQRRAERQKKRYDEEQAELRALGSAKIAEAVSRARALEDNRTPSLDDVCSAVDAARAAGMIRSAA